MNDSLVLLASSLFDVRSQHSAALADAAKRTAKVRQL
jgi:hypothetical protein